MKSAFFCGKCGRMLTAYAHHDAVYDVVCSCGHINQVHRALSVEEKLPQREKIGDGVAVPLITASYPHLCKKCGYGECEPTQISASYSDESDIYLYKCKKCGFVERQADGTGNT